MTYIPKVDLNIATTNSTTNTTGNDVLGNKNDKSLSTPGSDSLYGLAGYMAYYHVHSPAKVYPNLADPINVSKSTGSWALGSITELIPADTIEEAFDIHWIVLSGVSASGHYQVNLYAGDVGEEVLIGSISFYADAGFFSSASSINLPIQIPPQAANTRIGMAIASENIAANNLDLKIYYHEYPA